MENIQVAMRLRPINQKEEESGETLPWKIRQNRCVEINKSLIDNSMSKKQDKLQFFYDHCFPGATNNEQIYDTCAKKVIMSCLEGYNGTIFMYGQTGSGKTHTMLGYKNQEGVYNEAFEQDAKAKEIMKQEVNQEDGDAMDDLNDKFADMVFDGNKVDMSGNTGILIQSLKDIFKAIEQVKTYKIGRREDILP